MLISCATAGIEVNDSSSTAAIAQIVGFRFVMRPVVEAESPGRAVAVVEIFARVITALSSVQCTANLSKRAAFPPFGSLSPN
jgi:hypothetical protein